MKEKIPNTLTLTNLALGTTAIFFSINGDSLSAAILVLIAVAADFFDGYSARKLDAETAIGAQLDSLSDLVSFGVAPASLLYTFYSQTWIAIPLIILVLAGAYRLARYNTAKKDHEGFEGMPITINGVLIPIIFFFQLHIIITAIIVLVSAFLMVSKISFRRVSL